MRQHRLGQSERYLGYLHEMLARHLVRSITRMQRRYCRAMVSLNRIQYKSCLQAMLVELHTLWIEACHPAMLVVGQQALARTTLASSCTAACSGTTTTDLIGESFEVASLQMLHDGRQAACIPINTGSQPRSHQHAQGRWTSASAQYELR